MISYLGRPLRAPVDAGLYNLGSVLERCRHHICPAYLYWLVIVRMGIGQRVVNPFVNYICKLQLSAADRLHRIDQSRSGVCRTRVSADYRDPGGQIKQRIYLLVKTAF